MRMCSCERVCGRVCVFKVRKWQQVENDGQTAGSFELETTLLVAWSQPSNLVQPSAVFDLHPWGSTIRMNSESNDLYSTLNWD